MITSIVETDDQGVDRSSDAVAVIAEAELGPIFSAYGAPEFFFGNLLDVAEQQILYFKFAPGVKVSFRGQVYLFEELEKSGRFKLVQSVR
jgi:hypothetical protein